MSRTKDSTNQDGDNSLDGLVIDWHLFEMDMPVAEPVMAQNYQSTYAYA